MQTLRSALILLFAGYLWACSSASDNNNPLRDEAARYHTEATEVQAMLEPKIDQIDSLKTVLKSQPGTGNAARIATLDSVKAAFEDWESNLVEVPGMPHEHHHAHGSHEHHSDATLKDLSADQMRDLQREMLHTIRQLQARFDAVAPN